MSRRIYLASSWRNTVYETTLKRLRIRGHEVYDFKNPEIETGGVWERGRGFHWSEVNPKPRSEWSADDFDAALASPVARKAFGFDQHGLDWADTGVLLLPSGRSAHTEFGYLVGQGKPCIVFTSTDEFEPELMYLVAGPKPLVMDTQSLFHWLENLK